MEALVENHWRQDCEAVLKMCNECQEPIYNPRDRDANHECIQALTWRMGVQENKLSELQSEREVMLIHIESQQEIL